MNAVDAAIGTTMSRLEARGKATGESQFTDDMVLPGMLHAAILGSPHSHARIVSYDVSKALKHPGVKAVVTGADIKPVHIGLLVRDETALAIGRVRYLGEPVAAVAAVDLATAREATRLIDVEYEELPAVFTPEEAMAPGAPLLHENYASYFKIIPAIHDGNVLSYAELVKGDIAAGFAQCDVIVENTYETAAQYHAYMEPVTALADVDPEGKITVWSSTQSVFRTQASVSDVLGLPRSKVRALSPRVGGGFGAKSEFTVQPIAALLAQRTRKPVRLTLDRSDDMITMRCRHPSRIRVKTGAKKDGTLVAQEFDVLMDGGAYVDDSPAVMMLALYFSQGPYRIPHVKSYGRCVYTNKLRAGAFRGFGNPQGTFARESQMDALANKLGMDPIEFRLKNAMRDGDRWIDGRVLDKVSFTECLERARSESDWTRRRGNNTPGKMRGIGMAGVAHMSGFAGTGAIVRLLDDGSVSVNVGVSDLGQGSDTVIAQMCAGALGLSVDRINMVTPDTDASPFNSGTNGSRVTYMLGRAIGQATDEVRQKIFKHAAELFECAEEDIELLPGGKVGIVGIPGKTLSFLEISLRAHWVHGGPIIGQGALVFEAPDFDPKYTLAKGFMAIHNLGVITFGAQVAEVEIDDVTGKVETTEAWSIHDVGKAINPGAVEGQIQGGVVQGLGYALTEEMVWDGGRLVNPSFMDYKIPGALDVPYGVHAVILENPDATNPFGAKGVGEPPIIGIAAAVASAVEHASGARMRRIPITPERMLNGLKNR